MSNEKTSESTGGSDGKPENKHVMTPEQQQQSASLRTIVQKRIGGVVQNFDVQFDANGTVILTGVAQTRHHQDAVRHCVSVVLPDGVGLEDAMVVR
ncbi:MAG: hypothetical protein PHW10_04305 [Candidatus Peribacteraceae bacterium]|nr:hypothetical protein [Candidatus Peribacteraceae bacterium]